MQEPKAITYLKTFSDRDWKAYSSYAKSLYETTSSQAQVISYYKKKKRSLSKPDWDKAKLLDSIKPNLTAHALSNVLVKLSITIEDYFIHRESRSNELYKKALLLKSYAKRGLKNEFDKLKPSLQEFEKSKPISLWDEFYNLEIEHLSYYENMTDSVEESKAVLEKVFSLINTFYENLVSFYKVELVNREVSINEDWSEVKTKIKAINDKNHVTEICQKLMSLKEYREEDDYRYLRKYIDSEKHVFSKDINYAILIHLTSYLNHQIKLGRTNLSRELLELYKAGIDSGLLIVNGRIPTRRFYNILNLACGNDAYDWAEEFVEKYAILVDANIEIETKLLAKAEINFKKGNYEAVIEELVSTKYKNFDQELKARWLLICSEFELNRDNILFIEDRVRSMSYYLKRNEKNMDTFSYEGIRNLCKFLLKLTKPFDSKQLQIEISKTKYLVYRQWLLSKLIK